MPSSRKKPEEPQEEGAPAWMNTYGDMVTLVLTFFVLLFAFSTVDAQKWKEIVQSFSGNRAFTAIDMVNPPDASYGDLEEILASPGSEKTPNAQLKGMSVKEQFDELYQKIKENILYNGLEAALQVSKSKELIVIRITDQAVFDSGSDEIRQGSLPMLQSILQIFDTYQEAIDQILIEGHTDNVPVKSLRFRSNWELSTARAVTMVEYCIENSSVSPIKYAASGYGEYHPVASNDTEEGKAKNRRVDFVIHQAAEPEATDAS